MRPNVGGDSLAHIWLLSVLISSSEASGSDYCQRQDTGLSGLQVWSSVAIPLCLYFGPALAVFTQAKLQLGIISLSKVCRISSLFLPPFILCFMRNMEFSLRLSKQIWLLAEIIAKVPMTWIYCTRHFQKWKNTSTERSMKVSDCSYRLFLMHEVVLTVHSWTSIH